MKNTSYLFWSLVLCPMFSTSLFSAPSECEGWFSGNRHYARTSLFASLDEHQMFPLRDVLEVATKIGLSMGALEHVAAVLSYVGNKEMSQIDMLAVWENLRFFILKLYPELSDVIVPAINSEDEALAWIAEQEKKFGKEIPLSPFQDQSSIQLLIDRLELELMHRTILIYAKQNRFFTLDG